MVSSIRLRHGKGFLRLHSHMIFISTFFEEFVAFLDWVNLSKLFGFTCMFCISLMLMF
jgi:hypothetical protein